MRTTLLMVVTMTCAAVWSITSFSVMLWTFSYAGAGDGDSSAHNKGSHQQQQQQSVAGLQEQQKMAIQQLEEAWKKKEADMKLEIQQLENKVLKQEKMAWEIKESSLRQQIQQLKNTAALPLPALTTSAAVVPPPPPNNALQAAPDIGSTQQQQQAAAVAAAAAAASVPGLPACRVAIENRFDFHLEYFESVALMHPLPWDEWEKNKVCDTTQVAVVDLAVGPKKGRYFLETPSYENYFHDKLQHRPFVRLRPGDGRAIRYGDFVHYENYNRTYNAVIGLSCSESSEQWVEEWLRASKSHSCVLHRQFYVPSELHDQTCLVHPAWKALGRCFYLPTVLPRYPPKPNVTTATAAVAKDANESVTICVPGARRAHSNLAVGIRQLKLRLLKKRPLRKTLILRILMREFEPESRTVIGWYKKTKLDQHVRLTIGADFQTYQSTVGMQCDAILPLLDPEKNPLSFTTKPVASTTEPLTELNAPLRVSGTVLEAIGYKIPVIIHSDLEAIYHDYWTAPVYKYSTVVELSQALLKFLKERNATPL